jgi:hypothetical protein
MKKSFIIAFLLLSLFCFSQENYLDASGNLKYKKLSLEFVKPAGNYNYSKTPVFFNIHGALVEYFNAKKRISFLIALIANEKSLGFTGKVLRFRLSGFANSIEIVEDNNWLLKKNAITLFQLYKCYVKNMLFYISVYIMRKKTDKYNKVCLLISSPHRYYSVLKNEGYEAYLRLNFTD